jgi:hypothetical protein
MPSFPLPDSNRTNLVAQLSHPVIQGSPTFIFPGETYTFTITVLGSNAPTSPSAVVYQDGSDSTATNMPSGSASVSGQVITLKPFTLAVAGSRYSIIITFTLAGNVEQRQLVLDCVDPAVT